MSEEGFALDPRLAADSVPVATLPLCEVRLMDDARFAWLLLVPRRAGMVEVSDLAGSDQDVLWQETRDVAAALRATVTCDKLNLGALGNIVRQLHVHVIARREGDAAWPGPVWGHGQREPCDRESLARHRDGLRDALDRIGSTGVRAMPAKTSRT